KAVINGEIEPMNTGSTHRGCSRAAFVPTRSLSKERLFGETASAKHCRTLAVSREKQVHSNSKRFVTHRRVSLERNLEGDQFMRRYQKWLSFGLLALTPGITLAGPLNSPL